MTSLMLKMYFAGFILPDCPPGWWYYGYHCYFFSTTVASWFGARDACLNMDGQLLIVETLDERVNYQQSIMHISLNSIML